MNSLQLDQSLHSHGGDVMANAVRTLYQQGQTDYMLEPLVRVDEKGQPVGCIQDGDAVIFCCRRGEREIELTEAFVEPDFDYFPRRKFDALNFVILTLYHEKFLHLPVAFAPALIPNTLGETVSRAGLRQLRVSESEKFAHVTYFFNGGNHQPFAGEEDVSVPSPQGTPYEQVPELSLARVADEVIKGIEQSYDLIVTNFANGDVIGHTPNLQAKLRCAEYVDLQLGRVVKAALEADYAVLVTADHGNLEETVQPDGSPHVAHSSNPVQFNVIDPRSTSPIMLKNGRLADVAPTVLHALGLEPPPEMEGACLTDDHDWGIGRRVMLVILDGWGIGNDCDTNPIYLAPTPVWDDLTNHQPCSRLQASGQSVGLQPGKPGNSEAGHINLGAGRVISQDDVRLDHALQDGTFYSNEIFIRTIEEVQSTSHSLHLISLLTEKSSHGCIEYPLALLKLAKAKGLGRVYLHLIFDGRSTEPGTAPDLLEELEGRLKDIGVGQIATGIGRGFALDRDGDYSRIKRAYDAMVFGVGMPCGLHSYTAGSKK